LATHPLTGLFSDTRSLTGPSNGIQCVFGLNIVVESSFANRPGERSSPIGILNSASLSFALYTV